MPTIRYDGREVNRLAESLDKWYTAPAEAGEPEREAIAAHLWLLEWCISEDVPSDELARLAKKSARFARSLKRAKDIQELRLANAGRNSKTPAFIIFALKNVAGWRDVPVDPKSRETTLKLVVHLPDKLKQANKLSKSIDAKFQVIEPKKLDGRSKEARKLRAEKVSQNTEETHSISETVEGQ